MSEQQSWRYQHVERLGHEDVEGILDGTVTIQEKLDGTNLSIWYDADEKGLVIASRNRILHEFDKTVDGHRGAVVYVLNHPGIIHKARHVGILRGEWLVKNTVPYNEDAYGHFYLFDVQRYGTFQYESPGYYKNIAATHNVLLAPLLAVLQKPTQADLEPFTAGISFVGGLVREGIVIKRYDFVNKYGRTTWAKMLNPQFDSLKPKLKAERAPDTPEQRFADSLTYIDVVKVINAVRGDVDGWSPHMSGETLGRVWRSHFEENLWMFVKTVRSPFDFRLAQRLVNERTQGFISTFIANNCDPNAR